MNENKLNALKQQVADPEWPERLLPLFMFKGSRPARLHTLWNIAYAMYLEECDDFGAAVKTFNTQREYLNKRSGKTSLHWDGTPNEVGHFCGLHSPLGHFSLYGMFNRLSGCQQLTDSVDKGFTEYVKYLHPWNCTMQRVPLQSDRTSTDRLAWWRTPKPRRIRVPKIVKPKEAAWYLKDAPSIVPVQRAGAFSADIALMEHIHKLVPKGLPAEIKGDLCQDLLCAVLSGETTVSNLPDVLNQYARQARKLLPDRWKTVSLDDVVPGTDGLRRVDTVGACDDHF